MNREQVLSLVPALPIPKYLSAAPKQPPFELIEIEGAAYVWPRGINNEGDISGHLVMESENGQFGFIRRGDQVTLLSVPGAMATRAWGIDNEGRVAGHFYDSSEINASAKGFIYENGQYTTLIQPEAACFWGTQAVGINAGRVVGWFFDSASRIHGFLYVNGQWTQLDYPGSNSTLAFGINSAGRIVGSWQDREGSHGFSYQNGQYQEIMFPRPGAADTNLFDCNSDTIVGATGGIYEWGPFLLRRDGFTLLDLPGVFAYGINDSGLIVGDYGRSKGFVAKASAFFSKGDEILVQDEINCACCRPSVRAHNGQPGLLPDSVLMKPKQDHTFKTNREDVGDDQSDISSHDLAL